MEKVVREAKEKVNELMFNKKLVFNRLVSSLNKEI